MVIRKLTPRQKLAATARYIGNRVHHRPMLVCIEMTKHCNAGCDFCDDWRTRRSPKLGDVPAMVRHLNPMMVLLTGGEPLLERRLPEIVRDIKAGATFVYVGVVTNGALLDDAKAEALFGAGLDQVSISLNYLDERQDRERNIAGLWAHLSGLIPRLAARGHTVVANTVIMRDNLESLLPIARRMQAWGAQVSYSCYTHSKNGNRAHYFSPPELPRLRDTVSGLLEHKRDVGNITNSRFYLERIVPYFTRTEGIPGCRAGNDFVQLTPDGQVRQCADFAPFVHYTAYRGLAPTQCTRCWYACRGESEASMTLERVAELVQRT